MIVRSSSADAGAFDLDGFAPDPEGFLKVSNGPDGKPAALATAVSPPIQAPFPFDAVSPSWNVALSSGAVFGLELQVTTGTAWSEWIPFGLWGEAPASPGVRSLAIGALKEDTLELKAPARALRLRLTMVNPERGPARVRLAAAALDARSRPVPTTPFRGGSADLDVETRTQKGEQASYASNICSPTALAMVLSYWGHKAPTADWVRRVHDTADGIYGDWPFNTAAAAESGVEAVVVRMNGLDELEDELKAGRPVIISVTFKEGELPGAPIRRSDGHLLVVRGFTPSGDFIVNDPAAPDAGSVRRVYPRAAIRKVWLMNKRGVAYRIRPR